MGLEADKFVLVTIHRDMNTDDPVRLSAIFTTLREIGAKNNIVMVMPLHPRTQKALHDRTPDLWDEISDSDLIKVIRPVSFLEMILLEKNAKMIVTDSGGVQKESHFFSKPCIVLRKETEWVELVKNGTVRLADADPKKITEAWDYFMNNKESLQYPGFYGDGKAAQAILKEMIEVFRS